MWWQAALLLWMILIPSGGDTGVKTDNDWRLASDKAVIYLREEYSPTIKLIRESPETAPEHAWLATDNRLASWALTQAGTLDQAPGASELALTLTTTLKDWGDCRHGLIEALLGDKTIDWPPHTELQATVGRIGDAKIWLETKLSGPSFDTDWPDYADLALYGALDLHNKGYSAQAHDAYVKALTMFDRNEFGFRDKAYFADDNPLRLYNTYKLALAVYTAKAIGVEVDDDILQALLSKQAASGGFVTKYDANSIPQGDTNTETTSYALLALQRLLHSDVVPIAPPQGRRCRRFYLPILLKPGDSRNGIAHPSFR